MATGQQLQQVYELIKGGHKEHAASLLAVWLAADPHNADAWWLMALAAPSGELMRCALVRLLELRPDDIRARQLLDSLSVRQMLADARTASAEMQQAYQPAYPSAGLEPRLPRLRQRPKRRVPRSGRSPLFFMALAFAGLFGVLGCGLVLLALAGSFEMVGRAFEGIAPALPAVQASQFTVDLGDINALGNVGYVQYRTGLIESLNDRHLYIFHGLPGDRITIDVSTPNTGFTPVLALYGPAGTVVAGSADRSGETGVNLALALPAAGQYTLALTARQGTGEYLLELRRMP